MSLEIPCFVVTDEKISGLYCFIISRCLSGTSIGVELISDKSIFCQQVFF